jgi:hypothetical protein
MNESLPPLIDGFILTRLGIVSHKSWEPKIGSARQKFPNNFNSFELLVMLPKSHQLTKTYTIYVLHSIYAIYALKYKLLKLKSRKQGIDLE